MKIFSFSLLAFNYSAMRFFLKPYLLNTFTLWLVANLLTGVSTGEHANTIFTAALALSLLNFTVKPILNILFIPINFLTMGLFRWFTAVMVIYLVTVIVPSFSIGPFNIQSFSYAGIIIPTITLGKFSSLLVTTFAITLIGNLLSWIFKSEG